jgi:hypothetical protein
MTVQNSTFVDNYATRAGGAISNRNTMFVQNSTLSGNYLNGEHALGGGIYNSSYAGINSTLSLTNTLITNNFPGDCYNLQTLSANDHNLIADGSCKADGDGRVYPIDPKLGSLADNGGPTQTMAPKSGSPAIDAGSDATCLTTDQRGVPRPIGAHCDIGAVEWDTEPPQVQAFQVPMYTNSFQVAIQQFTATDNLAVTGYLVTLTNTTPKADNPGWLSTPPNTVTVPAEGVYQIFAWAKDQAGNVSLPYSNAFVKVDTTPPEVAINQALGQHDPTNASPVHFRVVFSEPVSGFSNSDVTLSSPFGSLSQTVTQLAPRDGTTYDVAVSGMSGSGTLSATIPAGAVQDRAGNPNHASTSGDNTVTYDDIPPTVSLSSPVASPTNLSLIPITITFSKSVSNFTASDLTVGNGTVSSFAGNGATYIFNLTPMGDGPVTVDISGGVAADAAGNGNSAAVTFRRTSDRTAPTVSIEQATAQPDPTHTGPIHFTVTFNEPVIGLAPANITLGGGAGADTAVVAEVAPYDGTTYDVAISGMNGGGSVTVSIPADAVQDAAGNHNIASTSSDNTVTYDPTPPSVAINRASGQADPANSSPIHFTAVFSKPIDPSTFDPTDLTLGGSAPGLMIASIAQIAPLDGTIFDLAVHGMTGSGTVTVSLEAGKVTDIAGNGNNASTATDSTVTYNPTRATTTVLTYIEGPQGIGQTWTLTASVISNTETPTGQVTFWDGTTVLGTSDLSNGTATFVVSRLSAGIHQITAEYLGSGLYASSVSEGVVINTKGYLYLSLVYR